MCAGFNAIVVSLFAEISLELVGDSSLLREDLPAGKQSHVQMIHVSDQQKRILLVDFVEMIQILLNTLANFVRLLPVAAFKVIEILLELLSTMILFGKNLIRHVILEIFEDLIEHQKTVSPYFGVVER